MPLFHREYALGMPVITFPLHNSVISVAQISVSIDETWHPPLISRTLHGRKRVDVLSPVEDLSYVISVFIQQLFQLIVRGKKKPFGAVLLGAAPVNGFSPPPRALTGPEPVEDGISVCECQLSFGRRSRWQTSAVKLIRYAVAARPKPHWFSEGNR
ncbi:unnamed protein product [Leuciscus chuanchicus]